MTSPSTTTGANTNALNRPSLARQSAVVASVVAVLFLVIWGMLQATDILLVLFIGLLVAIFLHAVTLPVQRWCHLSRAWGLTLVVGAILLVAGLGIWFLLPALSSQIEEFQARWPKSVANFRAQLEQTPWGKWLLTQLPKLDKSLPETPAIASHATKLLGSIVGTVGTALLVAVVGLMFAADPGTYRDGFLKLLPPTRRSRARGILDEMGANLQSWLLAQLASMTVIGILTWIGLLLLGIELAATLAIIAALLTFIPNFGPVLAAVPAVLMGLMASPATALWTIGLYIAVQTVETYAITPFMQYRALSLPPVLIIAFQLILGVWIGILGLALATPLLAAGTVLVKELYVEDVLHEDTASTDSS